MLALMTLGVGRLVRWIRHFNDVRDQRDGLVDFTIESRNPMEAYGFWWMLCEVVARYMKDGVPAVEMPMAQWKRELNCHHNKLLAYLTRLEVHGEVTYKVKRGVNGKSGASTVWVHIPKLLAWKDEYTRKSGHTPDQRRIPNRPPSEVPEEQTSSPLAPTSVSGPPAPPPKLPLRGEEEALGKTEANPRPRGHRATGAGSVVRNEEEAKGSEVAPPSEAGGGFEDGGGAGGPETEVGFAVALAACTTTRAIEALSQSHGDTSAEDHALLVKRYDTLFDAENDRKRRSKTPATALVEECRQLCKSTAKEQQAEVVIECIASHFKRYRSADTLTRNTTKKLVGYLKELGWKDFMTEASTLVSQLATPGYSAESGIACLMTRCKEGLGKH